MEDKERLFAFKFKTLSRVNSGRAGRAWVNESRDRGRHLGGNFFTFGKAKQVYKSLFFLLLNL